MHESVPELDAGVAALTGLIRTLRELPAERAERAERADRGIAHQVGLARRIAPHQARRYVGWARILTTELPETFAVLEAGKTSEYWGSPPPMRA
jgi:hypothetical protein